MLGTKLEKSLRIKESILLDLRLVDKKEKGKI